MANITMRYVLTVDSFGCKDTFYGVSWSHILVHTCKCCLLSAVLSWLILNRFLGQTNAE